jgi:hypothetical protein
VVPSHRARACHGATPSHGQRPWSPFLLLARLHDLRHDRPPKLQYSLPSHPLTTTPFSLLALHGHRHTLRSPRLHPLHLLRSAQNHSRLQPSPSHPAKARSHCLPPAPALDLRWICEKANGQPSQLRQYLRLSTEPGNRRYRASHTPPMSQRENRWPQRPPQTTLRTDPPSVLHLAAPAARKHPTLLRQTFRICPNQKSLQTRRAISRLPPYITQSPRSCLLQIRESRETKHPGDRLHHP